MIEHVSCHEHTHKISALVALICETRLTHMCDMTLSFVWHEHAHIISALVAHQLHSRVWHDSFMSGTWLLCMCEVIWFTHMTWLTHMWDIWVIHTWDMWLIHMCDMGHDGYWAYAYDQRTFMCERWLIHMCNMSHSCVTRNFFICVTSLIYMREMAHLCVQHDSFMRDMTYWAYA